MWWLGTVVFAWSAVYGYVGLYYCLLYAHRRAEREHYVFGLLSLSLCVYTFGQGLLTRAIDPSEGGFATNVAFLGSFGMVPMFVEFCSVLAQRRTRLQLFAYVWSVSGLMGVLMGGMIDATKPSRVPAWGFDWAPRYHEPPFTLLGQLHIVTGSLIAFGAATLLLRSARTDREIGYVVGTVLFSTAAALHDLLIRIAHLGSVLLIEHAGMIVVLAMSSLMLKRFVHTREALSLRKEELRMSYEDLRQTQEELVQREQLAAVGELSAVIAHEVRNPLGIIKNASAGLRRSGLSTDDRTMLLHILDEETTRLNRLVNDLLAYTKPVSLDGAETDLAVLVSHALDLVQQTSDRPRIRVTMAFEGKSVIECDGALLQQALVDIIDNAMHAMSQGGHLAVSTKVSSIDGEPAVALSIEDDGGGMDEATRSKAKDPFFTTRPTGTGLGLAIVERIVQTHGGHVRIESSAGVGTNVTLVLPERLPAASRDSPPEPADALPEFLR